MKKIFLVVAAFVAQIVAFAQDSDPVIMKINGNDIKRSEFEYSYNKNNSEGVIDKKDVQDYLQLYIDYKIKVEAAKDAGIDTLSNIKTELQGYREQMVYPTIENPVFVESQAYKTYLNAKKYYGDADLLECSHIFVLMRQDASEQRQIAAKNTIDSIYSCLLAGQSFEELAQKHSDDPGSAKNGGELPKFGKGQMIPDFEKEAYLLQPGQMSKPFKTTLGWHIVKMKARAPFEPYSEHHDRILDYLNKQKGFKEAAAEALIDSLAQQRGVDKTVVFEQLFNEMIQKDSDNKNLAQEYYDGTLMYEISKTHVWDKAAKDTEGLEEYFKKNKKKYAWNEPHFRGVVVYAKDKATFNQAKKLTKGAKLAEWPEKINAALNTGDTRTVRVEKAGVFKKGDNKAVDKWAFKTNAEVKQQKDFPYGGVVGKMLKKPQTYTDVRGVVVADYQKEKEDEWIRALRQKYPVEIYQDVVNTVNNH